NRIFGKKGVIRRCIAGKCEARGGYCRVTRSFVGCVGGRCTAAAIHGEFSPVKLPRRSPRATVGLRSLLRAGRDAPPNYSIGKDGKADMKYRTYQLSRDVTPEECSWLNDTVRKGEVVHEFIGPTYGCIGSGIAVSRERGQTPFFELPRAALDQLV